MLAKPGLNRTAFLLLERHSPLALKTTDPKKGERTITLKVSYTSYSISLFESLTQVKAQIRGSVFADVVHSPFSMELSRLSKY